MTQTMLQPHPIQAELEKALAEIGQRHGFTAEINMTATVDGLALFTAFKQAPEESAILTRVQADRLGALFNDILKTPVAKVADAARDNALLVSHNSGSLAQVKGFDSLNIGAPIVGVVLLHDHVSRLDGLVCNMPVSGGSRLYMKAGRTGQHPAKGDVVFLSVPNEGVTVWRHAEVIKAGKAELVFKDTVTDTEITVSIRDDMDHVWTLVKPVPVTVDKPRTPTKREAMKSRKPGQK